jgi:hypothetical protein
MCPPSYPAYSAYAGQSSGSSKPEVKSSTTVSAFIGDAIFIVYGYTHPHARVTLEGQGIFDQTFADEQGYFELSNRFSASQNREACVTAFDDVGGSSQPLCLAPFPNKKRVVIGPLILPPILSLNMHTFAVNDYGIISGKTVPQTDVSFNFFASESNSNATSGYIIPKISAQSDENGSFSISLPTDNDQNLRFFATTEMGELSSIKSTTLSVDILPLWKLFLQWLFSIFGIFQNHVVWFVLAAELAVLGVMYWMYARKSKKHYISRP